MRNPATPRSPGSILRQADRPSKREPTAAAPEPQAVMTRTNKVRYIQWFWLPELSVVVSIMLSAATAAAGIRASVRKREAYAACCGLTAARSRRRLMTPTIRNHTATPCSAPMMKNGESACRPGR